MASLKMKQKFTASGVEGFSLSSNTENNFAWNLGAGCSYSFNETFALDLGYRFASLGEAKTDELAIKSNWIRGKVEDVYTHQVMLGLRVTF